MASAKTKIGGTYLSSPTKSLKSDSNIMRPLQNWNPNCKINDNLIVMFIPVFPTSC